MKMPVQRHILSVLGLWLVGSGLLIAILACTGTAATRNIQIGELPQYICPSSTPRPTDTPLPTSPPTLGSYLRVNVSHTLIGSNQSGTSVGWYAQNTGVIYLAYQGITTWGSSWVGSLQLVIGTAPDGQAARSGSYPIVIPSYVTYVTVVVWSDRTAVQTLWIRRADYPITTPPVPPPSCCAPPPIYPTPRPTYTPYPTPTLYVRENDYFTGDPIDTALDEAALRIRFRLLSSESISYAATATPQPPPTLDPRRPSPTPIFLADIYQWTFRVENLGAEDYTFYPPAQSFLQTIVLPDGSHQDGVWWATYQAAQVIGVGGEGYQAFTLKAGQQAEFTLAAFAPAGTPWRISWVMDPSQRPVNDGLTPTSVVAGQNIVSWINDVNTICQGEVAKP